MANISQVTVIEESIGEVDEFEYAGDEVTVELGVEGPPGVGIPNGGTTHQMLRKSSDAGFATEWHTVVPADVGAEAEGVAAALIAAFQDVVQSYVDTTVGIEVVARGAAISAALDGLVDGSPGALDTLNEIAAALGDDPNFAATMIALIGGKQAHDANLDQVSALLTTGYGLSLLTLANAAALRLAAGLGSAAVLGTGTTSGTIPLLGPGGLLDMARLASGAPDGTKFVRDDGTLAVPPSNGISPLMLMGA